MNLAAYRELRESVARESRIFEDGWLPGLPSGGPRPPEIELQSRWFAGEFGDRFCTLSGQPVEIVQFGTWNHAAGPDFSDVAVRLGGRLMTGFLELDWDARDWERHGHAENPSYEGVVLHVFFEQPADASIFTRTAAHREVAQVRVHLADFPRTAAAPAPAEARCGRCSFPLRDMHVAAVARLFEAASRQRLERKAARLHRLAALHGWDQALFQELAAALGFRRNQWAMTLLAQRLPLKLLGSHPAGPEALLFGAAGFLETHVYEKAPPESREYLRHLWRRWWKYRAEFCGVAPPRWTLTGTRPQNHPHRRLGALAQIVRQWKRLRPEIEAPGHGPQVSARRLVEALHAVKDPFWDHHFTLTSAATPEPLALIGTSRIHDILANLAFPRWTLRPESAPALWEAFAELPACLDNEKSRRAALRLLGRRTDAGSLQKKLFHQQALLQIYEDFCLQDNSDCAQCLFPEQLARWTGVPSGEDG
jgi:hypothetical protein